MARYANQTFELAIDAGVATDTGRRRQNNEDWADFFEPTDPATLTSHGRLYIVADGVGGGAAGEVASEYAVRKVLYEYYSHAGEMPAEERLLHAVEEANADLHGHAQDHPDRSTMGSTVVAALALGDRLWVANVGDSRAYLVREGSISQLTRDHSLVARLVEEGLITPEQAETHPQRNIILRSLGAEAAVAVDLFASPLIPGDRVILCSDGLTRHVAAGEILDTVLRTQPAKAAHRLVGLANSRGGSDNVTVLVLEVGELAPARNVAKAAEGKKLSSPQLDVPSRARPAGSMGPRSLLLPIALGLGAVVIAFGLFLAGYHLGGSPESNISPSPQEAGLTEEPVATVATSLPTATQAEAATALPAPTLAPPTVASATPRATAGPAASASAPGPSQTLAGSPTPEAPASPTATATPTPTPSASPRPSRSPTATGTASPTASPTATPSVTPTP